MIASEQDRPDVVEQRIQWRDSQAGIDPNRVVFIDETWAKTNMTRRYGRSADHASLQDPVLDVHYQTRTAGKTSKERERIRFALIVTVSASKVPTLYDRIMQRYQTQLEPLRPVVNVPLRIS